MRSSTRAVSSAMRPARWSFARSSLFGLMLLVLASACQPRITCLQSVRGQSTINSKTVVLDVDAARPCHVFAARESVLSQAKIVAPMHDFFQAPKSGSAFPQPTRPRFGVSAPTAADPHDCPFPRTPPRKAPVGSLRSAPCNCGTNSVTSISWSVGTSRLYSSTSGCRRFGSCEGPLRVQRAP